MMKALTVRQPWASLILFGGKDIENREWRTDLRGRIAIHSSARMAQADMVAACDFLRQRASRFSAEKFQQEEFPLGAILGTVELVDCVQASKSAWFVGRFGLVLRDPRPLVVPVFCKGALGFWDAPELREPVTASHE
jgi:hypothetical protein